MSTRGEKRVSFLPPEVREDGRSLGKTQNLGERRGSRGGIGGGRGSGGVRGGGRGI